MMTLRSDVQDVFPRHDPSGRCQYHSVMGCGFMRASASSGVVYHW